MITTDIIPQLKGGLIVSCQARSTEPLYGSDFMAAMAKAAEEGGAVAIRANGPENIAKIKEVVNLPVIGINKDWQSGTKVIITPTYQHAEEIAEAGADIIAIDGTDRERGDGETLELLIKHIHQQLKKPIMADISTLEEAMRVAEYGVELIATTLSGYTPYSRQLKKPDLELVKQISGQIRLPVIAEGRYSTPEEVVKALFEGAFAVVVGTAITRPHRIVERFVVKMKGKLGK